MEFESSGLSKEEIRRKRRRKERRQAFITLSVFGVVLVAVIAVIVIFVTRILDKSTAKPTSADTQELKTQQVSLDPENPLVSDNSTEISENELEAETEAQEDANDEQLDEDAAQDTSSEALSEDEVQGVQSAQLETMLHDLVAQMTLEEKVAGLFFVTPEQLAGGSDITAIGSGMNEKMLKYPVGGFILDKSNMASGQELQEMIANFNTFSKYELFIGVVDEGGETSPFIESGLSENVITGQQEIGSSLGISGAYSAGISLGSELKQYGFNVNFAPLADVSLQDNSVITNRSFGVDEANTAALVKNEIKGMTDQKIFAGVKYFPSYGDSTQDGSSGPVISQRTKADLEKEFEAMQGAMDGGAKFIMISHVSLPKVRGDNRPASLSGEIITDIVRNEWGYDGIVITDFMNKSCMYQKYTYAEAAAGAIEAGADMILAPKNFEKSYQGILDAVKSGKLTEERINESLYRIYRVKFADNIEDSMEKGEN